MARFHLWSVRDLRDVNEEIKRDVRSALREECWDQFVGRVVADSSADFVVELAGGGRARWCNDWRQWAEVTGPDDYDGLDLVLVRWSRSWSEAKSFAAFTGGSVEVTRGQV